MALGQPKVATLSNEIPAIPPLLEALAISGCIVTTDADRLLDAIRAYWSIENECHWVLDVALNEDDCRIHRKNGSENFAILRRIALNLLKGEKSAKLGVANNRLKAAWDDQYLTTVLSTLF